MSAILLFKRPCFDRNAVKQIDMAKVFLPYPLFLSVASTATRWLITTNLLTAQSLKGSFKSRQWLKTPGGLWWQRQRS
jgi:hypothetical protein